MAMLAAAWHLVAAGLSEGSVGDAMRAQRAALEALKIASWANPTAERITTAQQGARERLMAAYPTVSEPEFVPTSEHTYTQTEILSLAAEDREMLYEFQLAQAKVHAGLALTMLQDDAGGSGQRGDALARQQSSVMDVIAQTEASSHKANSEQEEALVAKLRRAPAPLGLKFDDSPAPKVDRSTHDFSDELADSQRPASASSIEELGERPASASTSFEKLREFVPAPGASNGVGHGDDSVWLPNGAQRRQRRKYQDVVNHEKTLVDRVTDKDERIDSLVKERDARIGELEAEAKKLETKTKRMELAKTNEMVKERKLENDLIDSQKAQVSSEAQADDLRAQMEALQAHKAVTVSPGDEALASAIDQKLEAIQGQTEAAVKSALDVAAKATSQVDKLVAGAIARDKANELRTADSEASDGKADAVESSTKADELLRQMEANAERAAQKAKKLREKAELSESLKARKHDELKKLEALEAKAARKAKRAENDERASAADAWKAMSESAKIRKDTADAQKIAGASAAADAELAAQQKKLQEAADCKRAADNAATEERAKVEAEIEAELSSGGADSSPALPAADSLKLSAPGEKARKRVADAEMRKAAAEAKEFAAEADRVKTETAHLEAEEALKRLEPTVAAAERSRRERIVDIYRALHAAQRAVHDKAYAEVQAAQEEATAAQAELTKELTKPRSAQAVQQQQQQEAATVVTEDGRLWPVVSPAPAAESVESESGRVGVSTAEREAAMASATEDAPEKKAGLVARVKDFFGIQTATPEPPPMRPEPDWSAQEARVQQQQAEAGILRKKSAQEEIDDHSAGFEEQEEEEVVHDASQAYSSVGPFQSFQKQQQQQQQQQQQCSKEGE